MRFPSEPRPSRRQALRVLAAGPVLALAGGCRGLLGQAEPPPLLFGLTPKSTFPPDLPTVDWQLLVELPVAPAATNTARIVLQRHPLEIEYFARARWPDLAPVMVQALIIESFENSGAIGAVGRNSLDLRADFVLQSELREFQAEYFHGEVPTAHVGLLARLVQMPARAIVAFERFDVTREATENRLTEVVRAFDQALGAMLKSLVEWTLLAGEAARQASRSASRAHG